MFINIEQYPFFVISRLSFSFHPNGIRGIYEIQRFKETWQGSEASLSGSGVHWKMYCGNKSIVSYYQPFLNIRYQWVLSIPEGDQDKVIFTVQDSTLSGKKEICIAFHS